MTRETRNRIAAAIIGIPPTAFAMHMWLFFSYFRSRPREPHPDLGFTHALNNHGSYVFISDAESTGLALLLYAFLVAFGIALAIVPKDFQLPSRDTPRWIVRLSASFKTDLQKPTIDVTLIFLGSLASSAAFMWVFGSSIVDFFVARGMVLASP